MQPPRSENNCSKKFFANVNMGWLRLVGSFKIIGLFCRIWSLLQGSFAKETYNLKEPTNGCHLIASIIHPKQNLPMLITLFITSILAIMITIIATRRINLIKKVFANVYFAIFVRKQSPSLSSAKCMYVYTYMHIRKRLFCIFLL